MMEPLSHKNGTKLSEHIKQVTIIFDTLNKIFPPRLPEKRGLANSAVLHHDDGKLDPGFQRFLRGETNKRRLHSETFDEYFSEKNWEEEKKELTKNYQIQFSYPVDNEEKKWFKNLAKLHHELYGITLSLVKDYGIKMIIADRSAVVLNKKTKTMIRELFDRTHSKSFWESELRAYNLSGKIVRKKDREKFKIEIRREEKN